MDILWFGFILFFVICIAGVLFTKEKIGDITLAGFILTVILIFGIFALFNAGVGEVVTIRYEPVNGIQHIGDNFKLTNDKTQEDGYYKKHTKVKALFITCNLENLVLNIKDIPKL